MTGGASEYHIRRSKMRDLIDKMEKDLTQITLHLHHDIIPFWLERGIDEIYGGYLTCFDSKGEREKDTDKYLVTQTRMIWGLSAFSQIYPEKEKLLEEAKQGINFLINYFWDKNKGGWFWKVKQDGTLLDDGKVVYGQSFAIYALAQYHFVTGDTKALNYAERTFDLLQKYCTDTHNGGYYENFELNWVISNSGFHGGDRKSLDVHMHIMEAFTTLAECTKKEVHRRKLEEVIDLILSKMIDLENGCGLNQFDITFKTIPPIAIKRTWNAERERGQEMESLIDTTSYGHNLELLWLLNHAGDVLGKSKSYFNEITRKLAEHSLKYGFDQKYGGIYRDGPHRGEAIITDKEFWQNSESLVGFLDAFEKLGDQKYFDAFHKTWEFDFNYMINKELGEWYQLVSQEGEILIGEIGNPWKSFYHTGRSMMESAKRLRILIKKYKKLCR